MAITGPDDHRGLRTMVDDLTASMGERLHGVVLYGSAARGDYQKSASDLNLLVILKDLEPATLAALGPAFGRWRRLGQPVPRIFSPGMIADAADVFPIELLDIREHHVLLHGSDPFVGLEIGTETLRLQCEKELREKMMRLREAYVLAHGRSRALGRLLAESYSSFAALFRGCLHLLGGPVPGKHDDVIGAFCRAARLDPAPFEQVLRLREGATAGVDLETLFMRYYAELTKAVQRVDQLGSHPEA